MCKKSEYSIDPEAEDCSACGGANEIICPKCDGCGLILNRDQREIKCPKCDGIGWIDCECQR